MKKIAAVFIIFAFGSLNAVAADLMDIYLQALDYDPVFKEAYSRYMSIGENVAQARSALYPQLTIGGQLGRNYQDTIAAFGGAADDGPAIPVRIENTFNGVQWQVTASQAVFNYEAWAKLKQAQDSAKAAEASFNNAAQDLMIRCAKTYFQVLLARDTVEFAEAKKRANKRQYDQASQRFDVGLDAITSVYEAKAAYDQSIAEVIAANNRLLNERENLRKLTLHTYESLSPLRNSRVPLVRPEPNNSDLWVDVGLRQNYNYLSKKYALAAAKNNVRSLSAASWPTMSIQSNAQQTRNQIADANFFVPSKTSQANIALAMNFPIFQGGLVQSKTRQAQYDFQVSSEQLEQAYLDVVVNTRIAFNTIVDGISKVRADRQTVVSQQNSLESTEAQFQVGTRTMVDVVLAQQRLFEAQRQLAEDQYGLINANLQLKYLAGTLNVDDLELVNSWLKTTRLSGLPPASTSVKRGK